MRLKSTFDALRFATGRFSPNSLGLVAAMLTTLRIKNLALVVDLSLEFQPGFCAITGETGAGKSVLLGALKLVLGGRADRSSIRAGADACSVFRRRILSTPRTGFFPAQEYTRHSPTIPVKSIPL